MTKVLIVGRPNVGKSSLFNRLVRKKRALVLDSSGVTRDILIDSAFWWGHSFEVWDSGGLIWNESVLFSKVKAQVKLAIDQVDLIIFVVDALMGLHEEDKSIFKLIQNKKHLLVVNKVDQLDAVVDKVSEFYALKKTFVTASFEKQDHIDQIVEWVIQNQKKDQEEIQQQVPSLLMTGQCNVGKSSLCNYLLKKERMITSAKSHTTVDVVNETLIWKDNQYQILDTAGIRKKSRREGDLEKISSVKSLSFFEKATVIFLMIDATKVLSRQDIRLFSYCMEKHKPCILVINKWDLVTDLSKIQVRKQIKKSFSFFPDIPVVFTSAVTGMGVNQLMNQTKECIEKIHTRISTSELNQFFMHTIRQAPSPVYGTKNVKFYFVTQTKKVPPHFLIFTNEPKGVTSTYKKFIIKQIQNQWSLKGIPLEATFVRRR